MGQGASMPESPQPQSAMPETQQSQIIEEVDIDELVSWLEELWVQEETKEIFSEAEWQEFIDSVKNPYQ